MIDVRLRYQSITFDKTDVHVCTLRDVQEYSDPDGVAEGLGISSASWPLFGVVWPSSLVLAHYMYAYETGSKRVLEVGCGIALSSLLLNKQNFDITATDYHPEAQSFLNRNTLLNSNNQIAFERVNWKDEVDELGLFDVIIGSDVLYEDEHIDLLSDFVNRHAKSECEVIIADPGRGRKSKMSTRMIEFGFTSTHFKPSHTDYLDEEFKGYILKFARLN